MPFKSDKQRRYLYAEKPKVAKKFAMDKLKAGGRTDAGPNRTTASHATKGQINEKGQTVGGGQTTRDNNPTTTPPKTKTTTPPDRKFYHGPPQLPTFGPATWVANKVLGWAAPKAYDISKKRKTKFAKKEGLYRDYYRTNKTPLEVMDPKNKDYMKEAGYGKTKTTNDGGGGEGIKKCPDGSLPPCPPVASKPKVKVEPTVKTKYAFDDFKAYKKGKMIKKNKGGGVPYGPPPLRGPNPQVPPVKFSRGGGAALRGLKFTGVK
jgi:hypothetical protein